MEKQKHIVAFIDILGFKRLVENYFNGKDTKSLPNLKKALKDAENMGIGYTKQYLKQYEIKFAFKQFSDCVSISMPLKQIENFDYQAIFACFFNIVRSYQMILMHNNIYVRGGISIGGHIENRNMIFSDALVKSYTLETQSAIYPRILVSKEILELINTFKEKNHDQFQMYNGLQWKNLIVDWDDEVFINPFGTLSELKSLYDMYGLEILKQQLNVMLNANNAEELMDHDVLELVSIAKKEDRDSTKQILKQINDYLNDNPNEKFEVLLKYKWLKQFTLWIINPSKSQIKFKPYF